MRKPPETNGTPGNLQRIDRREKISSQQLIELRSKGMGVLQIARELGVTKGCISKRLKALGLTGQAMQEFEKHRKNPVEAWEWLEHHLMASLNDEALKKIPGFQRIMGAGIARDKVRILRGQDTEKGLVHWILLIDKRRRGLLEAENKPLAVDGQVVE